MGSETVRARTRRQLPYWVTEPFSVRTHACRGRARPPPRPEQPAPRPPYLEHEDARVGNRQADLGPLPVGSLVKPDAVHLQLAGDVQHLEVGLGRRLAPAVKDGRVTAPKAAAPRPKAVQT